MKNRRIVIVAFLLVAVLVMGIGYAALTDNLFIKGEATLAATSAQSTFEEDIYFKDVDVLSTTGTVATADTVVIGATDNDSATFYIHSLGQKNEYVVFKFTIANDSDEFDAVVSLDAGFPTTTDVNNFDITYSIVNDGTVNVGPITCLRASTVDVYVKVLLKNSPTENQTAAFNVNLTATSAVPTNP